MERRIAVLFLVLIVSLVACDEVDVSRISDADMKRIATNVIVCDPPYIRHGAECCVDKDSNKICDTDETPAPPPKDAGTPPAPSPTTSPSTVPAQKPQRPTTLTIVEYADFQEPFSRQVEPTIARLRQTYGDEIRLEYKSFPFENIHPDALSAAIASECARDQGDEKFWAYHDTLFQNQDALGVKHLKQYAQDLGLNTITFNACLDNKATEARVRADIREAESRGVKGAPSFWIEDELIVGALPYETFAQKIDDKLAGKPAGAPPPPRPTAQVTVSQGTHTLDDGEPSSKITIIKFADYQCPFSNRYFTNTEQQLIDTYVKTGKARYSVRNFPLSLHQNAQKAAEAAECGGAQGKFWEMHDTLYIKGNDDGTGLDTPSLKQYARELELDGTAFDQCLDNGEMTRVVEKDFQDGQDAGVSGTPSLVINGKLVVGAQPYDVYAQTIDEELATIN